MPAGGHHVRIRAAMTPPAPVPPSPERPDWYIENGLVVYTEAYHLKRGSCCGSGCRHCPYEPRYVEGNTQIGS